jgi:hypothetical protein
MINSTTPLTGSQNPNLSSHPSIFSTTSLKPSLGIGFTYTSDVTMLVQRTQEVFTLDQREQERGAGRRVVEVLKNKLGVRSFLSLGLVMH